MRTPVYHRADIKPPLNSTSVVVCPGCGQVLASAIPGLEGYNTYRQSRLEDGSLYVPQEYIGPDGSIQTISRCGLFIGPKFDADNRWRFCVQLAHGYKRAGSCEGKLPRFIFEDDIHAQSRWSNKHVKKARRVLSQVAQNARAEYVGLLSSLNPGKEALIAEWNLTQISLDSIASKAREQGLNCNIEVLDWNEIENRWHADLAKKAKEIRVTLNETEFPIGVVCRKCSTHKIDFHVILLITS